LGLDLSAFPNSAGHFERMLGRASVQKLLAHEEKAITEFTEAV